MERPSRSRGEIREPHLEADDLSGILAAGFGDDRAGRRRALYHFCTCCPACGEALEELSRCPPEPAWDARLRDGIVLALRHRVELGRDAAAADGPLAWLRSPHRYWLERMDAEPLAFARVVVEETRQSVLELDRHPELSSPLTRQTLKSLADDERLERLHPERFHDVRGLALAYLADDYQLQGQSRPADASFGAAERELARGTADAEVHTTLHELLADRGLARGLGLEARRHLGDAARLVRGVAMPGRAAETEVRLGLLWLELGAMRRAMAAFERGRAALVPGIDHGTRLRACHYLATAAVRGRRFDQALAYLDESSSLYGDRAPERLRVERLVMVGVSRLETGAPDAAAPLREAVEHLYRLRLWKDAARTLAILGRLYFTTGRAAEAVEIDERLAALLSSPAARDLSRSEHRRLCRDLARRSPLRGGA